MKIEKKNMMYYVLVEFSQPLITKYYRSKIVNFIVKEYITK